MIEQIFNDEVSGQVAGRDIVNFIIQENYARYRNMNIEQLCIKRDALMMQKNATYSAFIRHRTVPWFMASMVVLAAYALYTWGEEHKPAGALFALLWLLFAVAPSCLMMLRQRRALFHGLEILRKDLKLVEALIAIRDAERIYRP